MGRRDSPGPGRRRQRTRVWDRLADLADARGDLDELHELLDEGSDHAGELLTNRAVAAGDLLELQRLSGAGSDDGSGELDRLLAAPPMTALPSEPAAYADR